MNNKPPLGITPRHHWLRERVTECVHALACLEKSENWEQYRDKAKKIAEELLYCVTEWEKYYP